MGFFEKLGFTTTEEKVVPKEKVIAPVIQMPMQNIGIVEDPAYANLLDKALEARNLPGPDFLEYYKTLTSISNQPLPEQQKYILAFSGLNTMGLTKEKIIDTSKVYIDTLDKEVVDFQSAMQQYEKESITNKNTELQKLSSENIELQQKIQKNMDSISKLNIEIAQNTQTLAVKKQSFSIAIEKAKLSITTIITNVKNYL